MRLIPVSENEDDYARVPELVAATPAHLALKEGGKAAQRESINAVSFSLWLTACCLISAKAFNEFSSLWLGHLALLLPAPLTAVVVPALRVVGVAIEAALNLTGLSTI